MVEGKEEKEKKRTESAAAVAVTLGRPSAVFFFKWFPRTSSYTARNGWGYKSR